MEYIISKQNNKHRIRKLTFEGYVFEMKQVTTHGSRILSHMSSHTYSWVIISHLLNYPGMGIENLWVKYPNSVTIQEIMDFITPSLLPDLIHTSLSLSCTLTVKSIHKLKHVYEHNSQFKRRRFLWTVITDPSHSMYFFPLVDRTYRLFLRLINKYYSFIHIY